jgi:hypothetical protein
MEEHATEPSAMPDARAFSDGSDQKVSLTDPCSEKKRWRDRVLRRL